MSPGLTEEPPLWNTGPAGATLRQAAERRNECAGVFVLFDASHLPASPAPSTRGAEPPGPPRCLWLRFSGWSGAEPPLAWDRGGGWEWRAVCSLAGEVFSACLCTSSMRECTRLAAGVSADCVRRSALASRSRGGPLASAARSFRSLLSWFGSRGVWLHVSAGINWVPGSLDPVPRSLPASPRRLALRALAVAAGSTFARACWAPGSLDSCYVSLRIASVVRA